MQIFVTYRFFFGIIICCFLLGGSVLAQERDTSSVEIEDDRDSRRTLNLDRQFDRSVSPGSMTEMGTYSMPNETQYYHPPFEAQKDLDRAIEAYMQEMENQMGENWYWQFLRAVSPYVRLHLGVSEFNSLQIVGRDNPLFQSYQSDEKRQ